MSERNTEYQFVSTDTETVEALLISIYEKITGVSVNAIKIKITVTMRGVNTNCNLPSNPLYAKMVRIKPPTIIPV